MYIHRAGRTGRAGRPGTCLTLYTSEQFHEVKQMEQRAVRKLIYNYFVIKKSHL